MEAGKDSIEVKTVDEEDDSTSEPLASSPPAKPDFRFRQDSFLNSIREWVKAGKSRDEIVDMGTAYFRNSNASKHVERRQKMAPEVFEAWARDRTISKIYHAMKQLQRSPRG